MSNETIQELEARVEQLEEEQEELKQGAVDAQGRAWTVSDLLNIGLTRRQALQAIAAIAGGATLGSAIEQSVGVASADPSMTDGDGDVGTPENPQDVFADGVATWGSIVDRPNSTTVYDQPTQTVGDGTTSANHESVQADCAGIGTLEYDHSTETPHYPNQPIEAGPPMYGPYPGVSQPILSPDQVTDMSGCDNVADPFAMLGPNGPFHVFAEIFNESAGDFGIGHWSGPDPLSLSYDQEVLSDDQTGISTSYPYTFQDGDSYYMLMQNTGAGQINIYKFDPFPTSLSLAGSVLASQSDVAYYDPVLIQWNDRYWLFAHDSSTNEKYAYYADDLFGPYSGHPSNPIETGATAFNGGRPSVRQEYIDFPCRDPQTVIGQESERVRYIRIDDLTPTTYNASEVATSPVLRASSSKDSFNRNAMHHVDPLFAEHTSSGVVIVDGNGNAPGGGFDGYSIGAYTRVQNRPVGVRASPSSDVTLASGFAGRQFINFDAVDGVGFDLNNDMNEGTVGYFTAPETGYYRFEAAVAFASPSGTPFDAETKLMGPSGTIYDYSNDIVESFTTISSAYVAEPVAASVQLSEGEEVTVQVIQYSGANQTVDSDNTTFEVEKL